MRRNFTFQNLVCFVTVVGALITTLVAEGQNCSSNITLPCGGATENFNSIKKIEESGFFTSDFMLEKVGNDQFLATTNIAGQNRTATKTLLSNTYVAGNTGSIITLRFQLGKLLQRAGNTVTLNSYTIYARTESNTGPRITLCTGGPMSSGSLTPEVVICLNIATPASLSGRLFKFEFEFSITTVQPRDRLTFDAFGTNLQASNAALPVTFINVTARKATTGTQLTWVVADEHDVARYEIERSMDGRNFSSIGAVVATGSDTYSFTDAAPLQKATFYRIKNIDLDGRFQYSMVISVANGVAATVLRLFPIPAAGQATLQHSAVAEGSNAFIDIVSEDGRRLKSIRPATGATQTVLDVSGLQKGLYLVRYNNGNGSVETIKLVR